METDTLTSAYQIFCLLEDLAGKRQQAPPFSLYGRRHARYEPDARLIAAGPTSFAVSLNAGAKLTVVSWPNFCVVSL